MKIRSVDPRDQQWEIPDPKYRVYFFDSKGASDEYELEGPDVAEVLEWAETERRDRTSRALRVCAL